MFLFGQSKRVSFGLFVSELPFAKKKMLLFALNLIVLHDKRPNRQHRNPKPCKHEKGKPNSRSLAFFNIRVSKLPSTILIQPTRSTHFSYLFVFILRYLQIFSWEIMRPPLELVIRSVITCGLLSIIYRCSRLHYLFTLVMLL